MNFKLICKDEDLQKLTFDTIEHISVYLHRDCVSITNRVLGLIAGKEKVLEQLGKNTAEFRAKRRIVDLQLLSPHTDSSVPFMIIQVEEHWVPLLKRHVRHLCFRNTHPHYVKAVLQAVPAKHAIQRITLYDVSDAVAMIPYIAAEQVSFLHCHWKLHEIQKFLSIERPRLKHLFLEGVSLTNPLDLNSIVDVFIQYFNRYVSNTIYADKDILANETSCFRVDVRCDVQDNKPLPQFLLPKNLIVKINGVVQETIALSEDQSNAEDDDVKASEENEEKEEEEVLPAKKQKADAKKRKESSDGSVDEKDVVLFQMLDELKDESKQKEEEEEEDADVVEEKSEETDVIVLPKQKEFGHRERKRYWSALEKYMGPEKIRQVSENDPFALAMAKAVSDARTVTCKNCKGSMAFRDLAQHKRYCRKET